jgi:hypothetical protein
MLVDPSSGLEVWRFVTRALGRHRYLVGAIWLCFAALSVAAVALLPRDYWVQTRLLVRKSSIMPALVHPQRTVPSGSDSPTQSASELVHDREVLLRIVRDGRLVERWRVSRAPLVRAIDDLRARLLGPLTPKQQEEALVEMLDRRLHVDVQEEVVSIGVTWRDREAAIDIVTRAQAAFMDARRRADVEIYAATYRILEASVSVARAQVDERLKNLQEMQTLAKRGRSEAMVAQRHEAGDLDYLRDRVLDKVRDREELEQEQAKKVADLKLKLQQEEATLGPQHPDLLATREALAKASDNEESLGRARADEARLTRMYVMQGGNPADLDRRSVGSADRALVPDIDADYGVLNARTLLAFETDHYQTLVSRLIDTKLEMETAIAAFPGRFTVISPPKWPRTPVQPKVPLVLGGGMMAGLLAGSLAALLLEMRRRTDPVPIRRVHVPQDREPELFPQLPQLVLEVPLSQPKQLAEDNKSPFRRSEGG